MKRQYIIENLIVFLVKMEDFRPLINFFLSKNQCRSSSVQASQLYNENQLYSLNIKK